LLLCCRKSIALLGQRYLCRSAGGGLAVDDGGGRDRVAGLAGAQFGAGAAAISVTWYSITAWTTSSAESSAESSAKLARLELARSTIAFSCDPEGAVRRT
jgi:hypothetical protein